MQGSRGLGFPVTFRSPVAFRSRVHASSSGVLRNLVSSALFSSISISIVPFAIILMLSACVVPVHAQLTLPHGLGYTLQTEFSFGQTEFSSGGDGADDEEILELWLDVDYTIGDLLLGLRFVLFDPPDPAIIPDGTSSSGVDLLYGEYSGSTVNVRAGYFYALFGRGLGLRIYEDRILRVDTNTRGAVVTYLLPDGEFTVLGGETIKGDSEDADRGRSKQLYGGDFEYGLWEPIALRGGGSWVATKLRADASSGFEPLLMKVGRASALVAGVDLVGEFARVDGPNLLDSKHFTAASPNFHGHGLYTSASTVIGNVGLLFEYKDYDALLFRNNDGIDYIVPPAVIRDHSFSLLNRHPHQLDTDDEVGFQTEVTWVTERLGGMNPHLGLTSFVANWNRTRNQDDEDLGNYFDDRYVEMEQEVGESVTLIAGLSYQKSLGSTGSDDPFRRLWTPVFDLRYRIGDQYSLHTQYEHQHDRSDLFGEFDTEFFILEFARSPYVTFGLIVEHTNKSKLQLERLAESDTDFVGGSLDLSLMGNNELRLFYGTRNAGFICVGGVCRLEPAFDGFEMSLMSRF